MNDPILPARRRQIHDDLARQPLPQCKTKQKYDYVVIGKQTVLVEPGTRKIIQVIE